MGRGGGEEREREREIERSDSHTGIRKKNGDEKFIHIIEQGNSGEGTGLAWFTFGVLESEGQEVQKKEDIHV